MRGIGRLSVVCLILIAVNVSSADNELRVILAAEGAVQTVKVGFEEEIRIDGDGQNYHHTGISLTTQLFGPVSVGADYRQVYELKDGKWELENRPAPMVSIKLKKAGFTLNDKNKLEIRLRSGKDTALRYRNKLSITLPLKITPMKMSSYLADEVFIDEDGLVRNRAYLGLKLTPLTGMGVELFGLIESSKKDDKWQNTNVFGLKVKGSL